jgi:hypothetical protein
VYVEDAVLTIINLITISPNKKDIGIIEM